MARPDRRIHVTRNIPVCGHVGLQPQSVHALAARLTAELPVPTIGIGAGPGCSGQFLVLYDLLGIFPGRRPRFVRDFMTGGNIVEQAVAEYVSAVKSSAFPSADHAY
ncbi:MAG TPA: 3-methyl-2-oxobutanoate hydroxymethyltransferase [Casimicrobiaceae bacterium]|nr:3-methyl-2-oxobutanoate hydroxymethyltransferase [Casimicrobiaceae bacterium]